MISVFLTSSDLVVLNFLPQSTYRRVQNRRFGKVFRFSGRVEGVRVHGVSNRLGPLDPLDADKKTNSAGNDTSYCERL